MQRRDAPVQFAIVDEEDYSLPIWAGVLPLKFTFMTTSLSVEFSES